MECTTCGGGLVTAEQDAAMEGWCQKCQHWGISALNMARKQEGLAFWDRFATGINAVPESFTPLPGGDFLPERHADLSRATLTAILETPARIDDATRAIVIGEFLAHLKDQGVKLAEWGGGGAEGYILSELHPAHLNEVIAAFTTYR